MPDSRTALVYAEIWRAPGRQLVSHMLTIPWPLARHHLPHIAGAIAEHFHTHTATVLAVTPMEDTYG